MIEYAQLRAESAAAGKPVFHITMSYHVRDCANVCSQEYANAAQYGVYVIRELRSENDG